MEIFGIQKSLDSHLRIFPQGQFVAVEPDGSVVGSASYFIVSLNPQYVEHTWKDITADGLFTNHNSSGDSCTCRYIYTSETQT